MNDEGFSDSATSSSAPPQAGFDLVSKIVSMLEPLPIEDQRRVLQTVTTWLKVHVSAPSAQAELSRPATESSSQIRVDYPFAERREASPKEFLLEKDPHTDVERLAVLAYYLTHYRGQPHFKTEDLSKLNTEAAQRKFSNAALTAKNAVRDGFFVPAPKAGLRQLSALGEQYVQALPDHEAARALRKRMKNSRRNRSSNSSRRSNNYGDSEAAAPNT